MWYWRKHYWYVGRSKRWRLSARRKMAESISGLLKDVPVWHIRLGPIAINSAPSVGALIKDRRRE